MSDRAAAPVHRRARLERAFVLRGVRDDGVRRCATHASCCSHRGDDAPTVASTHHCSRCSRARAVRVEASSARAAPKRRGETARATSRRCATRPPAMLRNTRAPTRDVTRRAFPGNFRLPGKPLFMRVPVIATRDGEGVAAACCPQARRCAHGKFRVASTMTARSRGAVFFRGAEFVPGDFHVRWNASRVRRAGAKSRKAKRNADDEEVVMRVRKFFCTFFLTSPNKRIMIRLDKSLTSLHGCGCSCDGGWQDRC